MTRKYSPWLCEGGNHNLDLSPTFRSYKVHGFPSGTSPKTPEYLYESKQNGNVFPHAQTPRHYFTHVTSLSNSTGRAYVIWRHNPFYSTNIFMSIFWDFRLTLNFYLVTQDSTKLNHAIFVHNNRSFGNFPNVDPKTLTFVFPPKRNNKSMYGGGYLSV